MDWTKSTARRYEKHLSLGIWCGLYRRFDCTSRRKSMSITDLDPRPRVCSPPGRKFRPLTKHSGSVGRSIRGVTWRCPQGIWQPAYVSRQVCVTIYNHDDVIKCKHSPRYWPFVRGIHRSLVNSPHKGQWRGALMFSLICASINGWAKNREASYLGCHCAHEVSVMRACEI